MSRKNLFAAVVTALVLAGPSLSNAKPRFGLKLGLDMSNILVLPLDIGVERSDMIGALGGACLNLPVGKHFSLESELGYAMIGAEQKVSYDNPLNPGEVIRIRTKIHLDEVQIPILARFGVGGGKTKVLFTTGPTVGLLFHATAIGEDDGGNTVSDSFMQDLNTMNMSWTVGSGMEFPVGAKGGLSVDLRLNIGFSNIRRPVESDPWPISWSTLEETLGVSYFFN